jgi:hypothetical protein
MFALALFIAVVALALLLLYRVYVHHAEAAPYVDDDRSIVAHDVNFAGGLC